MPHMMAVIIRPLTIVVLLPNMQLCRRGIPTKRRDKTNVHSDFVYRNDCIDHIKIAERSFDKSITAIRIAMNSLSEIINGVEHDWVIHEILMQHKNMLHNQIDLILKEKRKL